MPEAKKPVEEKVPVVLLPEKKVVPAPKGRGVCSAGHRPDVDQSVFRLSSASLSLSELSCV